MDKTFLPQKNDPPDGQNSVDGGENSADGIQVSIYPNQDEINIADGGEFMDDAIRMKDQPFGETTAKGKE